MGFLDKAKQQASVLANKAQEGLSQGQAKLDEAQARKKGNELLGQLGAWQWAARHGRDEGHAGEEIARIEAALAEHEAEHGPIAPPQVAPPESVAPEAAAPPPPPAEAVAPPPPPVQAAPTTPPPADPPVAPPAS